MTRNQHLLLTGALIAISLSGCKKWTDCSYYQNENAQTLEHDGKNREYILYVPSAYDGSSEIPIVFNFHGFAGKASEYMKEADMRPQAEKDNFLLVYPQGSCLNGFSHWNACPLGGDNKSDANDFGFIEAMINKISAQYRVDQEKIYAVGYSNGGMMAYGLANYKSDLVAGVGSVSGAQLDCIGAKTHPMPVIHLHGTADEALPYNGNDELSSVKSTLNYWINFNNTTTEPTFSSDNSGGKTIEKYAYVQGDSAVSVEHYKYIGGKHVWFEATYQGQNTAELLWSFLSKYDIKGLR